LKSAPHEHLVDSDRLNISRASELLSVTLGTPRSPICPNRVSAMSHLRFCRATLTRDKIARQNRRCDMVLRYIIMATNGFGHSTVRQVSKNISQLPVSRHSCNAPLSTQRETSLSGQRQRHCRPPAEADRSRGGPATVSTSPAHRVADADPTAKFLAELTTAHCNCLLTCKGPAGILRAPGRRISAGPAPPMHL